MKRPVTWVRNEKTGGYTVVKKAGGRDLRGDFKIVSGGGSLFGDLRTSGDSNEANQSIDRMMERVSRRAAS
jgi:hypothetical protein